MIHLGLGFALMTGLGVDIVPLIEPVTQIVDISLDPPPPRPQSPPPPESGQASASGSAPRARSPAPPGGSADPVKRAALPAPTASVVLNPIAAGGGSPGAGISIGTGSGGGTGGDGNGSGDGTGDGDGNGDGGTDIEQIAGEIRRSDYPRAARETRLGGRVEFSFIVGVDGAVTGCAITRSSGVAELDQATCRIVTTRFRYRPATDSRRHPIPTQVDGEHVWQSGRE